MEELKDQISNFTSDLEELESEEQDAHDNLPESLQNGEKGENMDSAIENISSAKDEVESAVSSLEEAMSYLQEAAS
jgi:predicted  nucleic acid-binding Zn-ribbon protein